MGSHHHIEYKTHRVTVSVCHGITKIITYFFPLPEKRVVDDEYGGDPQKAISEIRSDPIHPGFQPGGCGILPVDVPAQLPQPGWISRFASATQTFAPRRRFHFFPRCMGGNG